MLCDDVIKLLEVCKDKYPDLAPEFIPIARKYGLNVAMMAQRFVENWVQSYVDSYFEAYLKGR